MGGGPYNTDIVRACCILTFPKDTHLDPIPLDGWYLFAAGQQYIHKITRECLKSHSNASILLRFLSEDADNATRYITCGSDQCLRKALQKTFDAQNTSLIVHIVDLEEWDGKEPICVQLEDDPNFSPNFVSADSNQFSNETKSLNNTVIDELTFSDVNSNDQTFESLDNDYVAPLSLDASQQAGRTIEASGSRFFLSSSWHLQAEEMSASMRLQSRGMQSSRAFEHEELKETTIDSSFVVIN